MHDCYGIQLYILASIKQCMCMVAIKGQWNSPVVHLYTLPSMQVYRATSVNCNFSARGAMGKLLMN